MRGSISRSQNRSRSRSSIKGSGRRSTRSFSRRSRNIRRRSSCRRRGSRRRSRRGGEGVGAEGAGGGAAVGLVVIGSAVLIQEAGTPSVSAPWSNYIFYLADVFNIILSPKHTKILLCTFILMKSFFLMCILLYCMCACV